MPKSSSMKKASSKKPVKPQPKKFAKRVEKKSLSKTPPAKSGNSAKKSSTTTSVLPKTAPAKTLPKKTEPRKTEAKKEQEFNANIRVYPDSSPDDPKSFTGWYFVRLKPFMQYNPGEFVLRYLKGGLAYYAPSSSYLPEHIVRAGAVSEYDQFQPVTFPK